MKQEQKNTKVLVVDDDPFIREDLGGILKQAGYRVADAADGKSALDSLTNQTIDLMLLDLELPRVHGMDVLRRTMRDHPALPVVIISGKGSISTAVEATKLGAYDFLEKPVDVQRTLLTVRNALEQVELRRERDRLLEEARDRYKMVGSSPIMQDLYQLIDRAARTDTKVLIQGESGTGKEIVARAIHHNGARAAKPFIAVNCAAIPEALIESELFGHEKGAYTGAYEALPGKFEQAEGGTLFLDEIGDMSLMTQAKVLRVLEEGRVVRVGGTRSRTIDVRIIAATHHGLEEEIKEGNFREDLFYRLNILNLYLPALRERPEDLPALIAHFLDDSTTKNGLPHRKLSPRALTVMMGYDWPGNVRQLRNVVERLMVLGDTGEITAREVEYALRRKYRAPQEELMHTNLRSAREQFERTHIERILLAYDGRIKESAEALGIDRSHLWKKMRRYGLEG